MHGIACWLLALLAPSIAVAECKLPALELPVQLVNSRPIVKLSLDGVEVPMLLDTGAFFSMLTEATADRLKLQRQPLPPGLSVHGYAGRMEASRVRVRQVLLEGVALANVDFIAGVNELGSDIGGVLGRNFMSRADMEFDLAHGVVRMIFPKGGCEQTDRAYWAGDAPVIEVPLEAAAREVMPAIRVAALVNGRRTLAMLDTGAPYTAIERRAALRAGVEEADMTPVGSVGGGGAGRVRSWTATIASFELGGEKISNNRFSIDDVSRPSQDMLIGLDYFLSHRIYVAWQQRKLYATWNGGSVFAKQWRDTSAEARYAATAPVVADGDAEALARRGQASAARKDLVQALQDLNRACELQPGQASHFEARAAVHLAMKSFDQARADLDTALGLDAGLHEARMRRAHLRQARGDSAGALADLQLLDEALPASSHLRSGMAQAFANQQRLPEALRQWEQWIATHRKDGGMAQVLNARCWLRARLGMELEQALEDCRQAVSLARSETSFHDSLGWVQLRMNAPERAVKAFTAALELQPKSAWSLYGRALALLRQGEVEAAARDLASARLHRPGIDDEVRKAGFPLPEALPSGVGG